MNDSSLLSSDSVQLAYRFLKQDTCYDNLDRFLHVNVAAYEVGDSFQQRQECDYAAIIAVACKVPRKMLQEDLKVLMGYDRRLQGYGKTSVNN